MSSFNLGNEWSFIVNSYLFCFVVGGIVKNSSLKNLVELYHENRLSHAYLIETNDVEKCFKELKEVIKEIFCLDCFTEKCEKCNICNLIDQNYLPSSKVIEAIDSTIKKEQILDLKKSFSNMPTYTKENIYVIKETLKLTSSSANTMLKFLEEPEEHIIGFFITNNINNVLPTIKSRCETLKVYYNLDDNLENIYENTKLNDVINYLNNIEENKSIIENKEMLLKYNDREDIKEIFSLILFIYEDILNYGEINGINFKNKLNYKNILDRIELTTRIIEDLNYNANIELLLDRFVIELGE
ncbi:hypothetical protein EGR52_03370 [bacterium]|nr:hypothetical protein [bacterium]